MRFVLEQPNCDVDKFILEIDPEEKEDALVTFQSGEYQLHFTGNEIENLLDTIKNMPRFYFK